MAFQRQLLRTLLLWAMSNRRPVAKITLYEFNDPDSQFKTIVFTPFSAATFAMAMALLKKFIVDF